MGRRPKGEGSIVKRTDGRWLGAYQDNGKRRYVYGKTRKEAAAKLRDAIWNVSTGKVEDSNITLQAYLSDWRNTTKNTLRVRTFKRYEQIVRVHLIPGLGGIKLKNLSPTPIQALYQKMQITFQVVRTKCRNPCTTALNLFRNLDTGLQESQDS